MNIFNDNADQPSTSFNILSIEDQEKFTVKDLSFNNIYGEISPSPPPPIQLLSRENRHCKQNGNMVFFDQNIQTEGNWDDKHQSWILNSTPYISNDYKDNKHSLLSFFMNKWTFLMISIFIILSKFPVQYMINTNDSHSNTKESNANNAQVVNHMTVYNISSSPAREVKDTVISPFISDKYSMSNVFKKEYFRGSMDMEVNWIKGILTKSNQKLQNRNSNDLRNTAINGRESSEMLNPGDCTIYKSMSSSDSYMIDLELRMPIYVTAFEYIHVNKGILSEKHWKTSPKDFQIYGAYRLKTFGNQRVSIKERYIDGEFVSLMVEGTKNRLKLNSNSILIPLHSEQRINEIQVKFGNWEGNSTCVYRMRIRGYEKEKNVV